MKFIASELLGEVRDVDWEVHLVNLHRISGSPQSHRLAITGQNNFIPESK